MYCNLETLCTEPPHGLTVYQVSKWSDENCRRSYPEATCKCRWTDGKMIPNDRVWKKNDKWCRSWWDGLFQISKLDLDCLHKYLFWSERINYMNPEPENMRTTKPTIRPVWPAKTQISMYIYSMDRVLIYPSLDSLEAVEGTCNHGRLIGWGRCPGWSLSMLDAVS